MSKTISITTMEAVVAKEALNKYLLDAEIAAAEYETLEAKKETSYNVPLIHPRVIVNAGKTVVNALNKALSLPKDPFDFSKEDEE